MHKLLPATAAIALLVSCGGSSDVAPGPLLPVFGFSHNVSADIEKIAGKSDGLNHPQDLDFNSADPTELWIVNKADDSTTTLFNAGTADQTSEHLIDPYALHFMEEVSSISFGPDGLFGTCQDSENTYNDQGPPNTFMGPSLWTSDFDIYALSNPEAVEYLSEEFNTFVDLGSHLDMLHESPLCMGIAWEKGNVYWVFDGYHSSINRYDFQEDHGPGYDDHSDGIIARWVEGKMKRKNGVVSHVEFDHDTGLLYIANTGRNRIDVLDTNTGKRGDSLPTQEPGVDHHEWKNADLVTLIDGEMFGMVDPAGIALRDGVLFVTDNNTSVIHAFDLEGNQLGWASTGLKKGSLAGIIAPSLDELWFVDQKGDAVYRLMR